MPVDHSTELDIAFWGEFFFETSMLIPHTKDSWECHVIDALNMYCMGGEL